MAPINPNVRAIPNTTEDVDAAKSLLEYLSRPEFLSEYYKVAIYGPVLQDQRSFEAFNRPVLGGLADLVESGTPPAYPDVYNTAYANFSSNFVVPAMVQRIVVDGLSIDEAMQEAQERGQAIYEQTATG